MSHEYRYITAIDETNLAGYLPSRGSINKITLGDRQTETSIYTSPEHTLLGIHRMDSTSLLLDNYNGVRLPYSFLDLEKGVRANLLS